MRDMSPSDRADLEEEVGPCPRCRGTRWVPIRGSGRPDAGEPCGCDEIDDEPEIEEDDDDS